jgi:glycogen synthase
MKILLWSVSFEPAVGGLETAACLLAREFVRLGHEVTVVTMTDASGIDDARYPFKVCRKPPARLLLKLGRWSDIIFHNHVNLYYTWPLLLVGRPWVVTCQSVSPKGGWLQCLKLWLKGVLLSRAKIIAISDAVAISYDAASTTISNPYDDTIFTSGGEAGRSRDLVFAGRLVSDKGAGDALRALAILRARGMHPNLSIAGDGPEKRVLHALARQLCIEGQVIFYGSKKPGELAALFNCHKIIVVPSRWEEPFGIVALEGIACGCVAVASCGGGLPEAIGPCGITFPNGDSEALADCLQPLLQDPARLQSYRALAEAHLAKFTPRAVAQRYIEHFEMAISQRGARSAVAEAGSRSLATGQRMSELP